MEPFIIKFEYQGQAHILEVQPSRHGNAMVYAVAVEEKEVLLEPGPEGNLHVVQKSLESYPGMDQGLLDTIAREIESYFASGKAEKSS